MVAEKQEKKVEKKQSPAKGGATKKSSPAKSGAVKKSAVMVEEFAVIFTGGKQYVVSVGDVVTIEKLPGEHKEGEEIIFDKIIPAKDTESVAAAWGGPTELLVRTGRGHDDLLHDEEVWEKLVQFVQSGAAEEI